MFAIAPRIIADENAASLENPLRLKVIASKGLGLGGLGAKGAALQPLGQKGLGKVPSKGQQGHEHAARPARRAFGDLTNATLSSATNVNSAGNGGKLGIKPQAQQQVQLPKPKPQEEHEPVERSFGKGWRDMEAELARQDAAKQAAYAQQLKRVVSSASSWSLSHLTPLQVGSVGAWRHVHSSRFYNHQHGIGRRRGQD
jgi:hypothetical protein